MTTPSPESKFQYPIMSLGEPDIQAMLQREYSEEEMLANPVLYNQAVQVARNASKPEAAPMIFTLRQRHITVVGEIVRRNMNAPNVHELVHALTDDIHRQQNELLDPEGSN